jgi:PhzF family phenazine biosynthesis protein
MPRYRVDLFDSFSEQPFGGSPAGIIYGATDLTASDMQKISKEIGAPATCFVTNVDKQDVYVRFFSTAQEYQMCGHGTLALMTSLVESGMLEVEQGNGSTVTLHTPENSMTVELIRRHDERVETMLKLAPAYFDSVPMSESDLESLFGPAIKGSDVNLPIGRTESDFTHLMIPINDLEAMRAIVPDYKNIESMCAEMQIDTVVLFTRETVHPESTVHCREFAPLVGTPEVPAAGTTNRALACYLLRYGLLEIPLDGRCTVICEQGYEMDRPSKIRTEFVLDRGEAVNIYVGGVATKVISGYFHFS